MDHYNFGRGKEVLVAQDLRQRGLLNVRLTSGSKGPYDISAQYSTGTWLLVQVKASRMGIANPVATKEDKIRLYTEATKYRARAYMAYVVGTAIKYEEIKSSTSY